MTLYLLILSLTIKIFLLYNMRNKKSILHGKVKLLDRTRNSRLIEDKTVFIRFYVMCYR